MSEEQLMQIAPLIGRKIVRIRNLTKKELKAMFWGDREPVTVIVLDDGSKLFPMRDYEGNGGGALIRENKEGKGYIVEKGQE